MIKVGEMTVEQFEKFNDLKAKDKLKMLGEILEVDFKYYDIGDTAVKINNVEEFRIYRNDHGSFYTYYVTINILDTDLAFAYSVYRVQ